MSEKEKQIEELTKILLRSYNLTHIEKQLLHQLWSEDERRCGMMDKMQMALQLAKCFPRSFVNGCGEFIAHAKANQYFNLANCETELDVKCKVLEWFSRGAYKSEPFDSDRQNQKLHEFMLSGINKFLGTQFTEDDMETIYTYLGNCCNHSLTVEFVNSGYDMAVIAERRMIWHK